MVADSRCREKSFKIVKKLSESRKKLESRKIFQSQKKKKMKSRKIFRNLEKKFRIKKNTSKSRKMF